MADPITITGLLAFYGAILSSVGLGWNLYRDLQDRARLKIEVHIRRIVRSPDGKWYQVKPDLPVEGASEKLFVVANVTNIGRRPVKWTGWGGEYHKPHQRGGNSFVILPTVLPIMLKEGESVSEMTDDLKAASADVKRLFIYDAAGKNWYLSRRALRKLKEESRESQQAVPAPSKAGLKSET